MIKQTKKVISILITVMLIVACVTAVIVTVEAAVQNAGNSLADSETLTVNANSNLFTSASETYSENDDTVTVTMYFQSSEAIANGEFEIIYDPAKLSFSSSNYNDLGIIKITPAISEVGGAIVNEEPVGTIIGSFTSPIDFYDFSEEKVLFNITFDIIGTGETTVDFNMLEMDYITPGTGDTTMLILNGEVLDTYLASTKATLALSEAFVIPTIPETTSEPEPATEPETAEPTATDPTNTNPTTTDATTTDPTITDPTIPEVFIGDADLDNTVTVKDATAIQMYCANYETFTAQQLLNADADRDNTVTVKDATQIQMYCAGFITEF